ncbi:unnamed protein product [Enterobius vermicularis]|uniref:Uncharacterized protein n=1 Tax=Enterobius vermicularis TaxID=51028 RepID=A0A0N4UWJ7_ENTVE|nr:unnamed protein product [Enterobius vermicularis]
MAQPQSSSGQPPPSPVVYPQGMMQGNVQSAPPSRPIYATSSQQMSAPQHASMPAGQYPSSYYPAPPAPPPKGQPAAYPPQSPMYRQSTKAVFLSLVLSAQEGRERMERGVAEERERGRNDWIAGQAVPVRAYITSQPQQMASSPVYPSS